MIGALAQGLEQGTTYGFCADETPSIRGYREAATRNDYLRGA